MLGKGLWNLLDFVFGSCEQEIVPAQVVFSIVFVHKVRLLVVTMMCILATIGPHSFRENIPTTEPTHPARAAAASSC